MGKAHARMAYCTSSSTSYDKQVLIAALRFILENFVSILNHFLGRLKRVFSKKIKTLPSKS